MIEAGDFQGHWPSRTRLEITARLAGGTFGFTVTASNTGTEDVPIGVGWHPYFSSPADVVSRCACVCRRSGGHW